MPVTENEIDVSALAQIIYEHSPRLVVVERAQAMPKQGVTSMFRYGLGYGRILGMLEALRISHQLVRPQQWKAAVLTGTKRDKAAAIHYVRGKYPSVDLTPGARRKAHDGIADSLCIAEFGRLVLNGLSATTKRLEQ